MVVGVPEFVNHQIRNRLGYSAELVAELLRRLAARLGLTVIARARSPVLLLAAAAILVVDVLVPDLIPFVDEMLLALVTVLLARWRIGRGDAERQM
jgi:hypothetical protein